MAACLMLLLLLLPTAHCATLLPTKLHSLLRGDEPPHAQPAARDCQQRGGDESSLRGT